MESVAMSHSEWFSVILGVVGLVVGVVGTGIAIYQTAVINESKRRRAEFQYLLAGISNLALSKSQSWINQINLIQEPENSSAIAIARVCVRARDDFSEIHNIALALEKSIDADSSAITSILEATLKQSELNNKIQAEGMKNPSIKNN